MKMSPFAALDRSEGAGRLGLPPSIVPVLVELRQLSESAASLEQAIAEAVGRADIALGAAAAAFARQLLYRDDLLILVDGLDEVAAERRGQRSRGGSNGRLTTCRAAASWSPAGSPATIARRAG